MEADNRPAQRSVRVNRLRATLAQAQASLSADGITARLAREAYAEAPADTPDALVLEGPALESSAAFREGFVTPQSRGSQLVAAIAAGAFEPGAGRGPGNAADLCAAPGGKTSQLALLLPGWRLLAVDDEPRRVAALRANLDRLGADDVEIWSATCWRWEETRPSAGVTTSSCSTRPAPVWARSPRDRTCAGGGGPAMCVDWPPCSAICWGPPRRWSRPAGR